MVTIAPLLCICMEIVASFSFLLSQLYPVQSHTTPLCSMTGIIVPWLYIEVKYQIIYKLSSFEYLVKQNIYNWIYTQNGTVQESTLNIVNVSSLLLGHHGK